jgi:ribose 5-phosphate isomerase A
VSAAAELKRLAAERAAGLVDDGMRLGLGTGSTARLVLEALAARRERGELGAIIGVPTSTDTREHATRLGIPLATLDDLPRLDLTIDGADEVDPELDLIKGLGGALLWEKIVASVSDSLAIVVDDSKLVDRLGARSPLPVEVIPFGWRTASRVAWELGSDPRLRVGNDGQPFITDGGHYIVDCHFPDGIQDPADAQNRLLRCPAVVDTGLFLGMADTVVVAGADGVRILSRPEAS